MKQDQAVLLAVDLSLESGPVRPFGIKQRPLHVQRTRPVARKQRAVLPIVSVPNQMPMHRSTPRCVFGKEAVPVAEGIEEWLLCLAYAAGAQAQ